MEAIRTLCDVVLCTYMCNVFKHKCIAVLSVFITMTEYCKCMHDGILYVYPHTRIYPRVLCRYVACYFNDLKRLAAWGRGGVA
jgi:hypothetical protein